MAQLPPIPPLDLQPPPISEAYELFHLRKHLAMLNGEPEYASSKEEVEQKMKHKFDEAEQGARQTDYSEELGMINLTQYRECVRCSRWVHVREFELHKSCHAAVVEQNLLLGDKLCAQSRKELIERMKVTHIVNAATELPNYLEKEPENIKYLKLDLCDQIGEELIPQVLRACHFIKEAHSHGGIVFVHCAVGKSRSVSVILLYLLVEKGITIDEGMQKLKLVRPIVKPNISYMEQLKEFESAQLQHP